MTLGDNKQQRHRKPELAAAVRQIAALIERAVADERRTCAEIADGFTTANGGRIAEQIATKIRARAMAVDGAGSLGPGSLG
jgi:hypothetical protein